MSGTHDENPPPPPPPQETQQKPTQQTPQTVSTIKLPILKKGEYDIWAMKIEHYLAHTDYPIWEVIQNGNGPVSVTLDTTGQIKILPPKTAEEMVLRERERKARTTLLMAIPEDHLAKFHKMTDAKDMWNAIKSRFGGNDESKKMQKYILKQQFEGFTVSNSDGIHKGYERFQSLLSQLEIHGAGVSTEDANQKFLRSLPSAWLQVSLIMRNKPGMDSLSFDDLYNNLRVFENDVKGSNASSSNLHNIAFVSENTNSTNEVSTAYGVSNTSGHCSKHEQTSTSSYSLLASQSSCPQLDHEDLDQVDEYDLEEMDLKWQVAMISMRIKKFQKKTGRKLQFDAKEPVGFDKTKVECYNCHKTGHFARECRSKEENRRRDGWNTGNREGRRTGNRDESISGRKEESKALVTVDGECVDWTTHSENDDNYAFMANNTSGTDTQVPSCSNECKESYANIKRLYDIQREQLSDASVEIKAYTQGLKKVEAQLVVHQQNQLWYEQKIKFMKIDLDDKTDVLTYHKTLLAKAQKDKNDLEIIVDKWNHSTKTLDRIINDQMSASDKFGLGYGDFRYCGNLSYENEISQSVFNGKDSDFENLPLYKKLYKSCEMQAVPPPMTGNYMPSGPDIEIDDSQYTYGPEKTQPSESEFQTTEIDICHSNISTETSELVCEPVVNKSKIEVKPKVWSDAPIIEEYESDSDDENVYVKIEDLDTPSFATKHVKTPSENVKNNSTHSQKPKVNNKQLEHGITERACFVCGSFSHLIRDCDYHVKLAKQVELHKQNMSKGNGTREKTNKILRKPTWDNAQRVNKQNQFVPLAVQTRTGTNPVNTAKASSTNNVSTAKASSTNNVSTARQSVNRQTVQTSTALKVNTVKPMMNGVRPANVFNKTNSPSSRPFKRTTDNPHRTLKNKGIIDSGCSRHMTGNKAYLADYQDINGGPVAFGGSKGYITGKGKIKNEFKNKEVIEFCGLKGIKREYCNAKNSQQMELLRERTGPLLRQQEPCLQIHFYLILFGLKQLVLLAMFLTGEFSKRRWKTDQDFFKTTNMAFPIEEVQGKKNKSFWMILQDFKSKKRKLMEAEALRTNLKHEKLKKFGIIMEEAAKSSKVHPSHPSTYSRRSNIGSTNKKQKALEDESWVDAMQEELLQFEIQKVWILVDLPYGKKESMDVRSAFSLQDDEEVLCLNHLVSKILSSSEKSTKWLKLCMDYIKLQELVMLDDIIFGSTKKSWCNEFEALMKSKFQMSSMGELTFFLGLQVKQKPNGIFISQDKYVDEILKKFDFANVKTASTPIETQKPLVKDEEASDVDVHLYRSMIGSLMYVTASRPDIMFAVCACSRFQVTPKTSHLTAVKRIFRYLKGKPKLGLWYPRESSFDLESYSDSDYAGANLDRKSTTGGCQFLGRNSLLGNAKSKPL
ncbi:ribonuclease H-like domain-containing protein [Tanacetum coccineum]